MRLLPNDREQGWTPYAWLIYLSFFVLAPFLAPTSTNARLLTLLTVLAFLPLYFAAHWVRSTRLLLYIGAMTLLGAVWLPFNPGAGVFFIYAASFAGSVGEGKIGFLTVGALAVALTVESWAVHLPFFSWIWQFAFTLLIGAIGVHYADVGRSNKRLRLAQSEIEHLAKLAERERIARDLHDLLGHTLSLVILKSELAAKLIERDPERARAEIADVEQISRKALTEVRTAVRGYKSAGLRAEIERTRHELESCGVAVECHVGDVTAGPALEAVLALALREASTNIVRHASAARCGITYHESDGRCLLTVLDDGIGGDAPAGNGLTGMRERVESFGGTLTRQGGSGTRLDITLPLEQSNVRAISGTSSR